MQHDVGIMTLTIQSRMVLQRLPAAPSSPLRIPEAGQTITDLFAKREASSVPRAKPGFISEDANPGGHAVRSQAHHDAGPGEGLQTSDFVWHTAPPEVLATIQNGGRVMMTSLVAYYRMI
ncbi:MAG: hypothetical protein WA918_03790 [Erythrobacter sp.]